MAESGVSYEIRYRYRNDQHDQYTVYGGYPEENDALDTLTTLRTRHEEVHFWIETLGKKVYVPIEL